MVSVTITEAQWRFEEVMATNKFPALPAVFCPAFFTERIIVAKDGFVKGMAGCGVGRAFV